MSQDPVIPSGLVDGAILNIYGHPYALVEDGIMPVSSIQFSDNFQHYPMVTFGGHRYLIRVQGAVTSAEDENQTRIRSHTKAKGKVVLTATNFLEDRLTAHYGTLQAPTTSQQVPNGPTHQTNTPKQGSNSNGADKTEKKTPATEIQQKAAPTKPASADSDLMTIEEVEMMLGEALKVKSIRELLFVDSDRPNNNFGPPFAPQSLLNRRRTPYFWWIVVDIAFGLASARLLKWVFVTARERGEKMGEYCHLDLLPSYLYGESSEKLRIQTETLPFDRFISWWRFGIPDDAPLFQKDGGTIFGYASSRGGSLKVSNKEENVLETVKCLFELSKEFKQINDAQMLDFTEDTLNKALTAIWPSSALEYILPHLKEASYFKVTLYHAATMKYALSSADRLIFCAKHLNFRPFPFNPMMELLSREKERQDDFKMKILPIIKALAHLATPGWCHILDRESQTSEIVDEDNHQTLLKEPILIFEDTIHQYDRKLLKPAPPIFDFEAFGLPNGEAAMFRVLADSLEVKDCSSHLTAIKAMFGCGTNLRPLNISGFIPFDKIRRESPTNASSNELRSWLVKQEANKQVSGSLVVSQSTTNSKKLVFSPSINAIPASIPYWSPLRVCSDTLKWSLIKGDVASAKMAFQNGDELYPIRDGVPQYRAYTEMMYEIVRQGRIESLKLLHEHGFPLKDVYLRRHLYPDLWISKPEIPSKNVEDIYYRLIIEACKAGNLEIVKYLREVAKSSWSSDIQSELHYHPFWYAIKMDYMREREEEEAEEERIWAQETSYQPMSPESSPYVSSATSSSSNSALTSISTKLASTQDLSKESAMDYFESQFMATNMADIDTGMPPSIYATILGSVNALKWMHRRGWSLETDRMEGATNFHFAIASVDPVVATWLLLLPFKRDFMLHHDDMGLTPFDWAVVRGWPSCCVWISSTEKNDLRAETYPQRWNKQHFNEISANLKNISSSLDLLSEISLEWADATPNELKLVSSPLFSGKVYVGFNYHDQRAFKDGLTKIRAFTFLRPGDIRNLTLARSIKHLQEPIEEYLTYRDTVLPNMGEPNHNEKRVKRWAQKDEKFKKRFLRGGVSPAQLVSDFAKRISKPINFEVDFWVNWCITDRITCPNLRSYLAICQHAGRNMLNASLHTYKREWLQFEPCVEGAVAPLLELIAANPMRNDPIWNENRVFADRKAKEYRQTNVFVVVARIVPSVCRLSRMLVQDSSEEEEKGGAKGWGTRMPIPKAGDSVHQVLPTHISDSTLIWMFTVLLVSARTDSALVPEVFIEVALTGSIPMAEWMLDHCELGDKTMDCYSMMMCQVVLFGSIEMLSWLFNRGFPLFFTGDVSAEFRRRFGNRTEMVIDRNALYLDFMERTQGFQPISFTFRGTEIKLVRRPNFLHAVIFNYLRNQIDDSNSRDMLCQRVDFLLKNGVTIEADSVDDAYQWDASHYIAIGGLDFLVDYLKMMHKITLPNRKDTKGRTPEDLRKLAPSKLGRARSGH